MTTTSPYISQSHSLSNLCDPSYFLNTHHKTPQTSTATSPTTTSPTSNSTSPEHRFAHLRHEQIRKPRKAGYIPAVLRPTEYHAKCGIKVNTTSSNTASHNNNSIRSGASSGTVTPSTSFPTKTGLGFGVKGMTTPPPLSAGTSFDSKHDSAIGEDGERSSSASGTPSGSGRVVFDEEYFKANVNRVVTDEWNEMVMECEVTGMPTRDHWKPDSSSSTCDDPSCTLPAFTFLTRRHHCRRCGHIFCAKHLAHLTPLDQQARFHPKGIQVPTCRCCWQDFGAWSEARRHRASASSSEEGGSGVATPIGVGRGRAVGEGDKGERKEMVVGSVKGDWNWSTF